uniref:Uncharacterized protein n=1 Tax=Peronospora matthiolae TaxID=2874970 RepID=A0AAV1T460_9STRA
MAQFEESTELSSSFLGQSDEVSLIPVEGEVTMMAVESANAGVSLWVGELLRELLHGVRPGLKRRQTAVSQHLVENQDGISHAGCCSDAVTDVQMLANSCLDGTLSTIEDQIVTQKRLQASESLELFPFPPSS